MKKRTTPLVIPEGSHRYWTVETRFGTHAFKHPYYGVGAKLMAYSAASYVDPEGDERSMQERYAVLLPAAGATLGACWYHLTQELVTPFPPVPNNETLETYGAAVAEEMQEAGYDLLEIVELFGKVATEFTHRQSLSSMAETRAAFIAPPTDASTSS